MLNTESIFSLFCTLSGLKAHEARQWRPLCESSAQFVLSRLRKDIALNIHMERICIAAASVAHGAWLPLAGSSLSGGQIRVGDITLTNASSAAVKPGSPDLLCQIADLLIPEGFAFVQTPEAKS